jgi:hypothetical protein
LSEINVKIIILLNSYFSHSLFSVKIGGASSHNRLKVFSAAFVAKLGGWKILVESSQVESFCFESRRKVCLSRFNRRRGKERRYVNVTKFRPKKR